MAKNPTRKICIAGTGAQAKYILDAVDQTERADVVRVIQLDDRLDDDFRRYLVSRNLLCSTDELDRLEPEACTEAIAAVSDSHRKEQLATLFEEKGIPLSTVVHPAACLSETAAVSGNVLINAGAVIQPFARIGRGVMIHANVVIEHNCVIEDFANIAPGAALAGWVTVGRGVRIYTHASVIPGISIGENAVVGAGAVVVRDVPENATVVGNPAKEIVKE